MSTLKAIRDAAESLREVLETDGHQVAVCNSGPQALAYAPGFLPEVVICDIGLPQKDGYEVARAFRAIEAALSGSPVAGSGWPSPEPSRTGAP